MRMTTNNRSCSWIDRLCTDEILKANHKAWYEHQVRCNPIFRKLMERGNVRRFAVSKGCKND